MAPAVTIRPLPDMISVDGPITSAGWMPSIVSGLPALPMPTMRPSRTPMSAFTTPQWSRITAPVITRSGAPSARERVDWPIDSRMTLPPPNTTSSPPTQLVLGHLDPEVGVGEPDAVARRRPVQRAIAGSFDEAHAPASAPSVAGTRGGSSGPDDRAAQAGDDPAADERYEVDVERDPGFEAHGRAGGDVESETARRRPVERERRVGLGEVVVRTDLDRPVAGVLDAERDHRSTDVDLDRLVGSDDLAGDEVAVTRDARSGDRVVQGDELRAVGERRFDLDLGEHVGDALHHVGAGEDVAAVLHQVGHTTTVAGRFEHPGGEHGDRLGVVEAEAPFAPRASDARGLMEHQSFLFVRAEAHGGWTVRPLGEHHVSPESRSVVAWSQPPVTWGQAQRNRSPSNNSATADERTGRVPGTSTRRRPG